jgi:KDO2-lipid IV(A) lauroyltransferase
MLALLHDRTRTDDEAVFLIRIVMRVFSWITPRAAEYIAPPLAAVLWYLSPRKRRATRLNLRAVYPQLDSAERRKIARDSMTHYVRGAFEAGMLWHWPVEKISACFDEVNGLELVTDAVSSGEGLIVAAPHWGSWEMLNLYLHRFENAAILYKPGRRIDFDEMLLEKRRRGGATMIPATGSGIRTMFKLLKSGHVVALLPDQEPTRGEGQFAPFFGVEALTGVLLPRMAKRTGVAVVFAVCERRKGGRYCIHLFRADESIYSDDMRAAVTAVNRGIEKCIEFDSAQYLWAYKRFRNRPDGEESFYKR